MNCDLVSEGPLTISRFLFSEWYIVKLMGTRICFGMRWDDTA